MENNQNHDNNTPTLHDVTTYPVQLFTTQKASENFRLSIIKWKQMGDKPKLSSDRCVLIPIIQLAVEPECLAVVMRTAFEQLQDSYIRGQIEDDLTNGRAPQPIAKTALLPQAIAEWNAERNTGERLTKDYIKEWFSSEVAEALLEAVMASKKLDATTATEKQLQSISNACDQFEELFCKLASPTFTIGQDTVIDQLIKAASFADQSNAITVKIASRLKHLKNKNQLQTIEEGLI